MTIIQQRSAAAVNACELGVTQPAAMDIEVEAGSFTFGSTSNSLATLMTHTCTADATYLTRVTGCLALNTTSGLGELVVDEVIHDGVDVPYNFDSNPYQCLHMLFVIDVPAGATDITSEELTVFHVIEPEPQPTTFPEE